MRFSAVILAGGKSSRMGRDKSWLDIHGQPLLKRQIQTARGSCVTELFISGRPDVDYSEFHVPVLFDVRADQGPLAGIERALVASQSQHLLALAVDLPQMSSRFLQRLMENCPGAVGVVPRLRGELEPLVAIYPKSCLPIAQTALANGKRAVREFALDCLSQDLLRELSITPEEAASFTNWNHPGDFSAD